MNKEIKLRKRRFWAICFVIVFAMIQSIPSSVLAAETYSTNDLIMRTTVLYPGDVINYHYNYCRYTIRPNCWQASPCRIR